MHFTIACVVQDEYEIAACRNETRLTLRKSVDFETLPNKDIHGNKLVTGYHAVAGATSVSDEDDSSGAPLTAANIQAAAVNAAHDAGLRIRTGTQVAALGRGLNNVVIFSIGLGNAGGGIEQDFMRRVSNDPQASNYTLLTRQACSCSHPRPPT